MVTTSARPTSTQRTPHLGVLAGGAAVLGLVAMAVGLTVAGGSYEPSTPGLPDTGPVVGWGLPILRMLTLLAAGNSPTHGGQQLLQRDRFFQEIVCSNTSGFNRSVYGAMARHHHHRHLLVSRRRADVV